MNLSFKEMCARFDVTPRTLRHYEYIELLSPARKGRTRIYGPREIARMKLILRGRRFGFSLEVIRQWLEIYEQVGEKEQTQAFLDLVDERIVALEAEKARIGQVISEMHELVQELQAQGYRPNSDGSV